ncbi:hypothetical protein ALC62_09708 [Cyphomyrmex costatus]|uniref:Uncharacterized protein n=1 Tax=Cyphomyrmex costatus TaxID=456900 RepID=A0A151IF48_9HYME|nr:hypothetical protein ALC62_09708 [Cyphomyrmex costatus]
MKSFRFFGPTRETIEEGDDVREPREGERTAVPGGNRQVVSRQLVSCGGETTKKGSRTKKACGLRNAGSMIPDAEAVCQTSEAAVDSGSAVYEKIKDRPEKEVASVTAWNRYQRLVAAMESRGGEFNRKSVIDAIFRGSDLVYVTH